MTKPTFITEDRIRERAYLLWLAEGQPEGRAAEHWEKARELLLQESDPENDVEDAAEDDDSASRGVPVEKATLLEFPAVKDEDKQKTPKGRPSVVKKRPM